MAKLTKSQISNLNRIRNERCAYGLKEVDGTLFTAIDRKTCQETGFAQMHANTAYNLVSKGYAQAENTDVTHTVTTYGETRRFQVQILVLTDKGREAIDD